MCVCVFEGAHGLALRENAPSQPLRRGAEVVEAAAGGGGCGGCGGGGEFEVTCTYIKYKLCKGHNETSWHQYTVIQYTVIPHAGCQNWLN